MKFMIMGSNDQSLINFRGPLIAEIAGLGHDVVACAPPTTEGVAEKLSALGARFLSLRLARTGLNPIADTITIQQMVQLIRRENPDVFLAYTIKPVVYGVPAARRAGVPRVFALVTGLGSTFNSPGWKGGVLRKAATWLYRRALPKCDRVFVQNHQIAEFFAQQNIIDAEKLVVLAGSGVDTEHFQFVPFPKGPPVFLLLARLLGDKGIFEYVEAARRVRARIPDARFYLAGPADPNPGRISLAQVQQWHDQGLIHYLGFVSDVRPLLAQCTACVLPSYHEGMPRSLLEAMATGRPVITTNAIGCRDTVFGAAGSVGRGENGWLVSAGSSDQLADAMFALGSNPGLADQMGRRGRDLAERHFDVRSVNARMLDTFGFAGAEISQLGKA